MSVREPASPCSRARGSKALGWRLEGVRWDQRWWGAEETAESTGDAMLKVSPGHPVPQLFLGVA